MNIETTADGSPTLYVPELDEHYHSTKGALTEYRTCLAHAEKIGLGSCTYELVTVK